PSLYPRPGRLALDGAPARALAAHRARGDRLCHRRPAPAVLLAAVLPLTASQGASARPLACPFAGDLEALDLVRVYHRSPWRSSSLAENPVYSRSSPVLGSAR